MLGFDGADALADLVYTTATLGLEKHLIDLFGDAGLAYAEEHPDQPTAAAAEPLEAHSEEAAAPTVTAPGTAPIWSADATTMLKKIPFFVRGRVQKKVERYAADHGHAEISADLLLTAKEQLGG
jgi:light-independent protochlorophyllide reductase subunit B